MIFKFNIFRFLNIFLILIYFKYNKKLIEIFLIKKFLRKNNNKLINYF
jgi:hypothetical protein